MALVLTDNKYYTDLANLLRETTGESTTYKPSELTSAYREIIQNTEGGSLLTKDGSIYNGVILPDLPEWDKDELPYASIVFVREGNEWAADLRLLATRPTYDSSSGRITFEAPGLIYYCYSSVTYAEEYAGVGVEDRFGIVDSWGPSYNTNDQTVSDVLWTSADIRNSDGSTYLEGSEPIPVNYGEGLYDSEDSVIAETVSIDYSQYSDGVFTETLDTGETITYNLTLDSNGKPTQITSDGAASVTVEW